MACVVLAAMALAIQTSEPTSDPFAEVLSNHDGFSGAGWAFTTDQIESVFATEPGMAEESWRWASVSKLVNAIAVLQASDEGLLSLSQPVSDFLESPNQPELTVLDLLRHTTGLAHHDDLIRGGQAYDGDLVSFCLGQPRTSPGGQFEYNNCDTVVAALLIEAVRGDEYANVLQRDIFGPAAMVNVRVGKGDDQGEFGGGPRLEYYGASGDLVGPGEAMVALGQALLRGELLSPASMVALRNGDANRGYVAAGAWSFSASLEGCEGAVSLLERRGHIPPVQVRFLLAPDIGRGLVVLTDRNSEDFGEIWMGRGLSYDLASAAFCSSE